jgi:hypothetical protein
MRYLFSTLSALAWALWLGGLAALFLFATHFFAYDRDLARQAAPQLFLAFIDYQWIVAGAALLFTMLWLMLQPSRSLAVMLVMLTLSSAGAGVCSLAIIPRMENLRVKGQTADPDFKRLHGESMVIYLGQTVCLLVAGGVLPAAVRSAAVRSTAVRSIR